MKLQCPAAMVLLSICALAATPARATHPAVEPSVTFSLSGQVERDAAGNVVGDPDATGVATLSVDHGTLVWSLTYNNLDGETVTGLHLHGILGVPANEIMLDLLPGWPPVSRVLPGPSGTLSGIVRPADDPGLLTRMAGVFYGNEDNFYLHVHTGGARGFPDGAMRGALPEPGALGVLGLAAIAVLRRR